MHDYTLPGLDVTFVNRSVSDVLSLLDAFV